jgi:hypothetical protein
MSLSQQRVLKIAFENLAEEMANFANNMHSRDAQRKLHNSCAEVRNEIRRLLQGPNNLASVEKYYLERIVDETSKIRVGLTRFAAGSRVLTNHMMDVFTHAITSIVRDISSANSDESVSLGSIARLLSHVVTAFEMVDKRIAIIGAC